MVSFASNTPTYEMKFRGKYQLNQALKAVVAYVYLTIGGAKQANSKLSLRRQEHPAGFDPALGSQKALENYLLRSLHCLCAG